MNKNKYLGFILCLSALLIFASACLCGAASAQSVGGDTELAEVGVQSPEITSIEPVKGGVKISWKKLDGVSLYRLDKFYSDGRGWVTIKKTSIRAYVDSSVTSGVTYKYRIMGIDSNGAVITPSVSKTYRYIAPPEVTKTAVVSNGIRVYWSKPAGVETVALYRRESGGKWVSITNSSAVSAWYVDKTALSGEYTYTVRAVNSDGSFLYDYYDETGVTVKRLEAPDFTVRAAAEGVEISWKPVAGAESYSVMVKKGEAWSIIGRTSSTVYVDKNAASGTVCTYAVRCTSADGKSYTSYYDTEGRSVRYVAAPVLRSADCTNDGIMLSWSSCEGAAGYRVFYMNSKGDWARMGDTTSTNMLDTDVRSGSTYLYTVRCLGSDGSYVSSFYSEGIRGTYLSAPVITSVSSGRNGVDISWGAVNGAVKYRVYTYGSSGWVKFAETSDTTVTDKAVSSGSTYTYTVRCINDEGTAFTSGFLSGKSVYYIAAPVISGFTNTEDGVKISWGAVKGAEKYRVYYYGSRGWTRMGDTTSTSFLDPDVSSGSTYTYTVRCLNSAGTVFTSDFLPGVKQTFIAAPDFSLTQAPDGITVSWGAVRGAKLYRIYRYTESGWAKLTDTSETSFTDTSISSGTTNRYTVRCLSDDGSRVTGDYKAGKSLKYIAAPKIIGISSTNSGVYLRWASVAGSSKYRVYHKTGSGSWIRLGDTSATSFTDTAVSAGVVYTYTLRCVNSAGNAFESEFYKDGSTIKFVAYPGSLKAECYDNSVRISWAGSEGAEKYRVYRYGGQGWESIAETSSTYATDSDVTSGKTYRYTVRCISGDGSSFTSGYDAAGVYCSYHSVPVLNACENTADGVRVSWKGSPGAERYRVYYYGDKGWTKLAETAGTSYTDTSAVSGTTRRYTVRCVSSDGKSFVSDCDMTGVSVYYVAAPRLLNVIDNSKSITFSWTTPAGASHYRVYKSINGTWNRMLDTTGNEYTDNNVSKGTVYSYTVRCVSSDGSSFLSGFDPYGFMLSLYESEFVYYDQTQYTYPYGDDTIAGSGCGPTCFAMVASTLLGRTVTPVDAVKWCGNKYYMYNVGTYWSYFEAASKRFGVNFEGTTDDIDEAIAALRQGKYVISSHGPGLFTRGGHFIVMAGLDPTGKVIVYDPNGYNNYIGTPFTRDQIAASGTNYWIFGE